MKDVGVSANAADVSAMFKAFNGRRTEDLIQSGMGKFASMPAAAAGGAAPAKAAAAPAQAPAKGKKEEKKAEEEEEDFGGFGDMFG